MELSEKQIIAYDGSNKRINIFEGAVSAGKSFIALLRFLYEIKNGPKGEYVIVGKSERTVLHNVIQPLQDMTGGIIRYNRGMGEFNLFGRKIYIIGASDERSESKIRGSTFAGALVDEITVIPESFFRMLLSRLRVPGAKLFGTTNPDSPYHWLKVNFIDRKDQLDLTNFQFRIDDNPYLTQTYIDNLKKEYTGLWHKRFILGQWVLAEGAIYDFFEEKLHCYKYLAPTYAKRYILGVDYGTTNPFAAVLIGINEDHHPGLWVEKEFYWDSKQMGYQKTDSDYQLDLKKEFGQYPISMVYLDPSAQSFEVELKRFKWPVKQAKNDVLDGIRFVGDMFVRGELKINQECRSLIREMESYVWDSKSAKDGVDKPLKQRDHAIDALRYALFTAFGHRKTLRQKTVEERALEAEQRRYAANPMAYPGFSNSPGWQAF